MNDKERAAMQQALGALVRAEAMYGQPNADIQAALREALAEQAEQEPVGYFAYDEEHDIWEELTGPNAPGATPLYTAPQPVSQEPVPDGGCLLCANGNDVPEGEWCRACGFSNESGLAKGIRLARGSDTPPNKPLKFTAPQPVKEVELTASEIRDIWNSSDNYDVFCVEFARAVIAAYKAKQNEC